MSDVLLSVVVLVPGFQLSVVVDVDCRSLFPLSVPSFAHFIVNILLVKLQHICYIGARLIPFSVEYI
jgi:hypothetical protein